MSYSLLIHDDMEPGSQAHLLRLLVDSAPRGTIVVRTKDGRSVMMRHPVIAGDMVNSAYHVYLAYKSDIVYAQDIQFVEAYDPHPEFNPEGV